MAVIDIGTKTMTLKIVYFGCALGGKTTNLVTLHRLTDPEGARGLVSIATKDDRTLFFDLLPMDLGLVGGFTIRAKAYTVPGQPQYEVTRRQVLSGADAVVLVVDSSPEARQPNGWTAENLRANLTSFGIKPDEFPTIVQWNKRDLPEAVSVEELEIAFNPRKLPSFEAVATSGAGVVETFAAALKGALLKAYGKAGRNALTPEVLEKTIAAALRPAQSRAAPPPKPAMQFEHRVDTKVYQAAFGGQGIDRKTLDQSTLLTEAVQTGMELAEKLDGLCDALAESERCKAMVAAISRLAASLVEPSGAAIPAGLMKGLLHAANRTHGSILLYRPNDKTMDEREVVPGGQDPLNSASGGSLGSAAYRLAQIGKEKLVEDVVSEVFFNAAPPSGQDLTWALSVPIACDGIHFGMLLVYGLVGKSGAEEVERDYWTSASVLLGLALHWRALKRKLAATPAQPRPGTGANPAAR